MNAISRDSSWTRVGLAPQPADGLGRRRDPQTVGKMRQHPPL